MSEPTRTLYPVTIEPRHFYAVERLFNKALTSPNQRDEILAMTAASMIVIAELLMAWLNNADAVEKTMESAVGTAIEAVIREMPGGMR